MSATQEDNGTSQNTNTNNNDSSSSNGFLSTVTGAASAAGTSVAGAASSAYNSAPDLGVSSTAQAAYQKAPDLGISSRLNGVAGGGQDSSSGAGESSGAADNDTTAEGQSDASGGAQAVQRAHEARLQKSKEAGPSSEKRLNQSQTAIGIEDGIPTAAGAGTTLPQDATVQSAYRSGAERHEAKVPQDYEPVDCPTKHAGDKSGKHTVPVGHSSSEGMSAEEQNQRHSQEGGEGEEQANGGGDGGGAKSKMQKFKNAVKGDVKIVSGALTNNDAKKEAGHAIKKGEA